VNNSTNLQVRQHATGFGAVHRPAEFDFPAERAFSVSVVAGHGLLSGTTFTLVLVAMLAG
jgi:hypothetical protein